MNSTRDQVAAKVRQLANEKFPYQPFQSGPKETLRRALGYVDRRTMNDRWVGRRDYTTTELAQLAALLEVPLTALLPPAQPSEGALGNPAPDSRTTGQE
jgi:hypothetical protein